MKGFTKRLIVGAMAASMVLSTSLVALAEDPPAPAGTGTSGGTGSMEGIVKTDVYKAALPTEDATAYNYIVDPQGLIRKTNAAKYAGKTFGEGTIFFPNTSGENDYSNTSDAVKIVNKSSKNLSVTVTATATPDAGTGEATLATAKPTDASAAALEVYLGITDTVDGNTEKALTAAGVEMKAVLGAAPEDAYEYKYDSTGDKYSYDLKDDVSTFKFAEYSFQINGEANTKGEWKAETKVPTVSVKWDVDLTDDTATVATPDQTPPEEDVAPSIAVTSYNYDRSQTFDIVTDFGSGASKATSITSVKSGSSATAISDDQTSVCTINGNTITFPAGKFPAPPVGTKKYLEVTFDSGDSVVLELTITK